MERFNDVAELLDSIYIQTYRDFETIVITERSTKLYDRIRAYTKEKGYSNVQVLFNPGPWGLSSARNMGIKEAKGSIVAFIDDDALPFDDWLEQIVKTFDANDSVIGLTGTISPLWQDSKADWFPSEFDWLLGGTGFLNLNKLKEVRNVFGTNMSFRREAYNRDCLFLTNMGADGGGGGLGNQKFACEETEFSMRIREKTGKRLLFNPEIKVKHKVYRYRITPLFIAKRAYSEGYTKAMFTHYYRNKQKNILNVECDLLRRILTQLFPQIFVVFLKNPANAWRKLWVTMVALISTAAGYINYWIVSHWHRRIEVENKEYKCGTESRIQ